MQYHCLLYQSWYWCRERVKFVLVLLVFGVSWWMCCRSCGVVMMVVLVLVAFFCIFGASMQADECARKGRCVCVCVCRPWNSHRPVSGLRVRSQEHSVEELKSAQVVVDRMVCVVLRTRSQDILAGPSLSVFSSVGALQSHCMKHDSKMQVFMLRIRTYCAARNSTQIEHMVRQMATKVIIVL